MTFLFEFASFSTLFLFPSFFSFSFFVFFLFGLLRPPSHPVFALESYANNEILTPIRPIYLLISYRNFAHSPFKYQKTSKTALISIVITNPHSIHAFRTKHLSSDFYKMFFRSEASLQMTLSVYRSLCLYTVSFSSYHSFTQSLPILISVCTPEVLSYRKLSLG